jgi:hypothetical protein
MEVFHSAEYAALFHPALLSQTLFLGLLLADHGHLGQQVASM